MGCRRIDAERAVELIYEAAQNAAAEQYTDAEVDLRLQQANRAADLLIKLYKEEALTAALRIEARLEDQTFAALVRKVVAFRKTSI